MGCYALEWRAAFSHLQRLALWVKLPCYALVGDMMICGMYLHHSLSCWNCTFTAAPIG